MIKLKPENVLTINNEYKYCTDDILVKGTFCILYKGYHISDENNKNKKYYTIKSEPSSTKHPQLKHEFEILSHLQKNSLNLKITGIPKFSKYYHSINHKNYIIMDLYGYTLDQIFELSEYKLSHISVFNILNKILEIIKYIHLNRIIHRDIEPSHLIYTIEDTSDLLFGNNGKKEGKMDSNSDLILLDYGLCKYYCNSQKIHINFKDNKKPIGNIIFCSIWNLIGIEESRRDDLDAFCNIMIYLMTGKLPWMNIKAKTHQEIKERIKEIKISISPLEICKNVPLIYNENFLKIIEYVRSLQFTDEPNYDYIKNLINNCVEKCKSSSNKVLSNLIVIKNRSEDAEIERILEKRNKEREQLL